MEENSIPHGYVEGKISEWENQAMNVGHQSADGGRQDVHRDNKPPTHHQEVLKAVLHLYVDHEVESAEAIFEKPIEEHRNLTLKLFNAGGLDKYWKSEEIIIPKKDYDRVRYKFIVKYQKGVFGKLTSLFGLGSNDKVHERISRKLYKSPDQFCIFDPHGHNIDAMSNGHFFFIKMLYDETKYMNTSWELLIKCEHVGFGSLYYGQKQLDKFAEWLTKEVEQGLSYHQSCLICVLLYQLVSNQFYRYKRTIVLSTIVKKRTVDTILESLQSCPKDYLPDSSIESLKWVSNNLHRASSKTTRLHYINNFLSTLGVDIVLDFCTSHEMEKETEFDSIVSRILERLAVCEEKNATKMFAYLIDKAPALSSLWKLHVALQSNATSCTDLFLKKIRELFAWYKKPNLLEVDFWQQVPTGLKEALAVEFCHQLARQMKDSTRRAEQKTDIVITYLLDRDLQKFAKEDVYKVLETLAASVSIEHQNAARNVLNHQNIAQLWDAIEEDKRERLAIAIFEGSTRKMSGKLRKEKVNILFECLADICQIGVWKNDEKLLRTLRKTACVKAKDMGLDAVVDAYESISSLKEAATYMKLLRSLVAVEQARGDSVSQLLGIVRKCFPDIDRGREEILLALVCQSTLLQSNNDTSCEADVLQKMIEAFDLWKLAFGAKGEVARLTRDDNYLRAKRAVKWFANTTADGTLPFGFLEKLDKSKLIEFCCLTECDPGGGNEKDLSLRSRWSKRVHSLIDEKTSVKEKLRKLNRILNDVFKTASFLKLELRDKITILEELSVRGKTLDRTTYAEALDSAYWGPLGSIINCVEGVDKFCDLNIFANCMSASLHEFFKKKDHSTEDKDDTMSTAELLSIMTDHVLPYFKTFVPKILAPDGSITVGEMDQVLRGIDDVEGELQRACRVLDIDVIPGPTKGMIASYKNFPDTKSKVESVVEVLRTFELCNDSEMITALNAFVEVASPEVTLKYLFDSINQKDVQMVDKTITDDLADIMKELSVSKELVDFVRKTANDDMVYLIDAVEEHSDQLVQASTVSYLIDVHRFVCGLIKSTNPEEFIQAIESSYNNIKTATKERKKISKSTEMAAKVKVCGQHVHSLRGLHESLENRGELTKQIIANAVRRGCFQIEMKRDGPCEVLLTYPRREGGDERGEKYMVDLHDLRSRALLIVNADKGTDDGHMERQGEVVTPEELSQFIEQVDLVTEVSRKYELLRDSGLPTFQKKHWKKLTSLEDIQKLEKALEAELMQWNAILSKARGKHFFLNFFHASQIWNLKQFFTSKSGPATTEKRVAFNMLRLIDPRLEYNEMDGLKDMYKAPKKNDTEAELCAIGEALGSIFEKHSPVEEKVTVSSMSEGNVEPGKVFVAVLEPESKQTIHVIMSLFQNTTASLPKPSQVLFCHPETTWEEVELLLLRAFEASSHNRLSELHCIANVQGLPNDLQFDLVDTIKKFTASSKGSFRLAVVCCGGAHNHFADEFADNVHHLGGMADADIRQVLAEQRPQVYLVTSELPGQGKTETIHTDAALKRRKVYTVPISGPMSRSKIVNLLCKCCFKPFHAIHFSIGAVDDPQELDILLFELIVVGSLAAGTKLFQLPIDAIYIEISNTLGHSLRDSLPVTKCFKRLEGRWEEYKNTITSNEITSPIQVVCHYLLAREKGTLETTELLFSGPQKLKPLSGKQCMRLLAQYVVLGTDPSFSILENFLTVLADQLIKFTRSQFFKPQHLSSMFQKGQGHDVRVKMFDALFQVALSFAARSVATCKAVQAEAISEKQSRDHTKTNLLETKATAGDMVARVESMIKWADNENVVIVFHGSGSVTAIYRAIEKVPQSVNDLFQSQAVEGPGLEDYNKMSQEDLQVRLERICNISNNKTQTESNGYALTPDNFMKMALILQRMQAGIPIIIMGETGCGKTSLVRYLAVTCDVKFYYFQFHAGITQDQIVKFIRKKNQEANNLQKTGKPVWVFLDEINTCDHLGTINEIVCHRNLLGTPLASNLVFIAACNPYRLRDEGKILTAGLGGKADTDEKSRLVYRVQPLPETMIDYVWDFGSLDEKDEEAYIGRMVEGVLKGKHRKMLVELLAASQAFVRLVEKNPYCVSLRDVRRTSVLINWFAEMLEKRKDLPDKEVPQNLKKYFEDSRKVDVDMRAIILSLAHCYVSRLPSTDIRKKYCDKMTQIFQTDNSSFSVNAFQSVVRAEQEDYLLRMELPEGTARNAALRENVFVILVCILNRIPVFVVGKPGCSKSLSMQIIRSNLRGKDSKDPFLKTLPQLFVVSFQGSESSTSDGIEKVFEKAKKYKKADNVLPVVLLDEIGLAEVSKFNPLKVLHRLLEHGDGTLPDVGVVGISNWALDAAKMNRAVHLSRPEPDVEDLFQTGLSLREAQVSQNERSRTRSGKAYDSSQQYDKDQIRSLAEAYFDYQKNQKQENFHGLRDYYSMVKCIGNRKDADECNAIQVALQRNFGGRSLGTGKIQSVFLEKLKKHQVVGEETSLPVKDLIRDNLYDKTARHLMVITNGDSAIGILDSTLADLKKEKITIFGSRFEEDLSADYNYRVLSRIILCMERDCVLILRDLENIYGSLYDMLNQNYVVVGGKKNCRVALGPYSNPMCQVHDGFRCIVLVDQSKVDYTDPPFLNRFEKQLLRFSDVLCPEQASIIEELKKWTKNISNWDVEVSSEYQSQDESNEVFAECDMFAGFHEDTLPSLVLKISENNDLPREEIVRSCKNHLMDVACPDGVLRSEKSRLNHENDEEVRHLSTEYFNSPQHHGFRYYLECSLNTEEDEQCKGRKFLVMTHSNIHADLSKELEGLVDVQSEKLSSFKSEKQLSKRIKQFWLDEHKSLFVLQCLPEHDSEHMLLAKANIELQREKYFRTRGSKSEIPAKHVCIVVHLQRGRHGFKSYPEGWQFNFLSGWTQMMLDELQRPRVSINSLLGIEISNTLTADVIPIRNIISSQLSWCFTRIRYPPSMKLRPDEILKRAKNICSSEVVLECFQDIIKLWLSKDEDAVSTIEKEAWQVSVACDRKALANCSTFVKALEHFVYSRIREPLAKIVFFMENNSLWNCISGSEEKLTTWRELMDDPEMFDINKVSDQQGAESLVFTGTQVEQLFPFSPFFRQIIDNASEFYSQEYRALLLDDGNLDMEGRLTANSRKLLLARVCSVVEQRIPALLNSSFLCSHIEDYVDDILDVKSEMMSSKLCREVRVKLLRTAFLKEKEDSIVSIVSLVHSFFWEEDNVAVPLIEFVTAAQDVTGLNLDQVIDSFLKMKEGLGNEDKELEDTAAVDEETEKEEQGSSRTSPIPVQESLCDIDVQSKEPTEHDERSFARQEVVSLESVLDHENPTSKHYETCDPTTAAEDKVREDYSSEECKEESAEHQDDTSQECEKKGEDMQGIPDDCSEGSHGVSTEDGSEGFVEEETQTLEIFLVEEYCKALLPTKDIVSSIGGVVEWAKAVIHLLPLASKLQTGHPIIHFLRVCHDFLTEVLLQESLKPLPLYHIAEIGLQKEVQEKGFLDSPLCFQHVCEVVDGLRKDLKNEDVADEFMLRMFARCIDSNQDTEVMPDILQKISLSEDERLLTLAYPIIYRVLRSEKEAFALENYDQVLSNKIDEFPNLVLLSDVLSAMQQMNNRFVVMCCDLISEVAFRNIKVEMLSGSESPELRHFNKAMGILLQENIDSLFTTLCSVAYVRFFLASLAEFIRKHPNSLTENADEYSLLIDDINAAMTADSPTETTRMQVGIFLLKQVHEKLPMFELKRICEQNSRLKALKDLMWSSPDPAVKLSLNPFDDYENSSTEDTSSHPDSLNSSKRRMNFAASKVTSFYLLRSARNIKDTEDKAADLIAQQLKDVSKPYEEFILRILNRKAFGCQKLDISPETCSNDVQLAAFLAHLTAVITSNCNEKSQSTLELLLTDPVKLKGACIPSLPKKNPEEYKTRNISIVTSSQMQCYCEKCQGLTVMFKCSTAKPRCASCGSSKEPYKEDKAKHSVEAQQEVSTGYVHCETFSLTDETIAIRQLTPVEFRVLHLLIHSLLLMGNAINLIDNEKLAKFLFKDDDSKNAIAFCLEHVTNDLQALCKLLCSNNEDVTNFLHCALKETTSSLLKDFGVPLPLGDASRSKWERGFAMALLPVLEKFQHCKIKPSPRGDAQTQITEDLVNEVVQPSCEVQLPVPSLFRNLRPKSFQALRCNYMNSPRDLQEKHALIGLFLEYHDKLRLVNNLVPIIKWCRLVENLLGRRLTRAQAKDKPIGDAVIRGGEELLQLANASRETLEKQFECFRKAWEDTVSCMNTETSGLEKSYIGEMDPIGYCLVEQHDYGQSLCKVLAFLTSMQNEFLEKVLSVAAAGKCASLGFLQKGASTSFLSAVHLQDAHESEVIQYKWTDIFLDHCQHHTEYGRGIEIIYDLEKIEKDMAFKFLLGKAYLTTQGGLREFVFSKRLFHDCAQILTELEQTVPQEPLPEEVKGGLKSLIEDRLENAKTLLENTEIVLCFLKRTGGKPDESLKMYTTIWKSQGFSKDLFPRLHDNLRLKHVVALYEFLEDKLSDAAVSCVEKQYRQELPAVGLQDKIKELEEEQQTDVLDAAVVALKRFIFRYIDMKPEPGHPLKLYMADPSLWPMGVVGERPDRDNYVLSRVVTKVFPEMLVTAHVHALLECYEQQLQVFHEKRKAPRLRTMSLQFTGPTGTRRPKRKGGRGGIGAGFS
ncbi:uncharacterized protein LOC5509270 [Nematostella vectensis]|uniref:uncharacterized protein LOC5509270 n=1 Tax=Nematostella vectensis TaxID=45351 RepID=UPI0020770E2A|nr:uncharacterized protein LOC5509270 [Nematostella vectensis]XP_032234065.2 uncharacterized protein LOC5509270 [Nematostella vectensis]XP_048578964.1 uncharacterized protein LOC5509270 [Nematostella vectensis]XP_048578965.1 uncharacterized protein LOC5509270 [Nematostella vectensis]